MAGKPRIGVLALQGAFAEHAEHLRSTGSEPAEVRLPADLNSLDGLILPGGESTTMGKLLRRFELIEPLRALRIPVWGTCAGMILLGREVVNGLSDQPLLGLMDLRVTRNAFGRQVDSFVTALDMPLLGAIPLPAVFIRAPLAEALSADVEVLARHEGRIVAARQGRYLATSFHPELSRDSRLHAWFVEQCLAAASVRTGSC